MNQLSVSMQHSIATLAAKGWSSRKIARELKLRRPDQFLKLVGIVEKGEGACRRYRVAGIGHAWRAVASSGVLSLRLQCGKVTVREWGRSYR